MRGLIVGHSQETSDKITELPTTSGKRNPEDLCGRNGKIQSDRNKGSITKTGAIAENQEKFILRSTRSKTADQAQEVTDTNSHLPVITGKIKPGAQSGETGYVPSTGNQGSSIGEGLAQVKPVLIPTEVISESDEPETGAAAEKQINLRSRMTRPKTASQAQETIEHSKFSKFKPGK
eukprot:1201625-Ditylum_brightwellii.AAC.1